MVSLQLWLALARPILHLHYDLFGTGRLHGKVKEGGRSVWSYSLRATSLPWRLVTSYARSTDESHPDHRAMWALPLCFLGEMRTWRLPLLKRLVTCLQITMGQLWRRFVVRLQTFPWLLSPLVQDEVGRAQKLDLARAFMAKNDCCLDEMFSLKLRNSLPSPESLLDDAGVVGFLKHALQQAMPTTTHIEDGFAHIRRNLNLCWRAPSMHTVSAHHVLAEHKRVHGVWLKSLQSKGPHDPHRRRQRHDPRAAKRPIWVWSRRKRNRAALNGFNAFVSEHFSTLTGSRPVVMSRLGRMWRELPPLPQSCVQSSVA